MCVRSGGSLVDEGGFLGERGGLVEGEGVCGCGAGCVKAWGGVWSVWDLGLSWWTRAAGFDYLRRAVVRGNHCEGNRKRLRWLAGSLNAAK